MADTSKNMVIIVAILAIVILVGLVFWFVQEESDSFIEIGFGSHVPHYVISMEGGIAV